MQFLQRAISRWNELISWTSIRIDDIDIKFPQCIMVAYRGCYAMISPYGNQFYYTWKMFLWKISKDELMTIYWMMCYPRHTTRMLCEQCNIDIVYLDRSFLGSHKGITSSYQSSLIELKMCLKYIYLYSRY